MEERILRDCEVDTLLSYIEYDISHILYNDLTPFLAANVIYMIGILNRQWHGILRKGLKLRTNLSNNLFVLINFNCFCQTEKIQTTHFLKILFAIKLNWSLVAIIGCDIKWLFSEHVEIWSKLEDI